MATTNHWVEAKCAKAFWGQHDLRPYRRLLADTVEWSDPKPREQWLDLGCGGGAISRALWEKTAGQLGEVVGVDCAAVNELRYEKLRAKLSPERSHRLRFVCHNFIEGLEVFPANTFDHAVSGLSISYAECYDPQTEAWTTQGYERLLREVYRVIRPGGRFVFSVNVPEPSWRKVALFSLPGVIWARKPLQFLKNAWRMMAYGAWLKREARKGRFLYLPAGAIRDRLASVGFAKIEHRLSYAGQAYIFRAEKPL